VTPLDIAVMAARVEFHERAVPSFAATTYLRESGVDQAALIGFIGSLSVMSAAFHEDRRFDFADDGVDALVLEGFGADGETVVDLVAWPLAEAARPACMFGRVGLLGLWEAMGAATYAMGGALTIHATPLDWLRAGCRGAAIVDPRTAARQMLDLPGKVLARDVEHGRYLRALVRSVVPDDFVLVPERRAA
jgi:hypothetical protein